MVSADCLRGRDEPPVRGFEYGSVITQNCTYIQTAATQYWERFVLNLTDGGLGEPGNIEIILGQCAHSWQISQFCKL